MLHWDTHMSPKYNWGQTSSPWWHEWGPECRTSSSSCRDTNSSLKHLSSTSGSFFVISSEEVAYFVSSSVEGFLSDIALFVVWNLSLCTWIKLLLHSSTPVSWWLFKTGGLLWLFNTPLWVWDYVRVCTDFKDHLFLFMVCFGLNHLNNCIFISFF